MTDDDRTKYGRKPLGHTEQLALKLHPDLLAWVKERAADEYCTDQEIVRRLILEDMRRRRP